MKSSPRAAPPITNMAGWVYVRRKGAERASAAYALHGNMPCHSQSAQTALYSVCRRARKTTIKPYVSPASPYTKTAFDVEYSDGHGALMMAERSKAPPR